ncbi:molecular chaperone DnaK [Microbacterium caowuchunii]|uniref:TraR/DksA family transcriptional regulator n=1 Tax=Microbacterium caowuchunii TaxID=2614638 RepID=UPI0012466B43|nr:TraR/DksA C4-type zinc finger protein [Microbacterium caowuchunii]QEW00257.1 molecular chaperone DnaK [Microbacterium caowuchunii]
MDAATRAEFRALLTERRREAERDAAIRQDALGGVIAARDDPAGGDDEHDPEGATLADEWSRLEGLRIGALRELSEIDAALGRLRDGTFGICVRCGAPIPVERLRARPTATMCVPCASRR